MITKDSKFTTYYDREEYDSLFPGRLDKLNNNAECECCDADISNDNCVPIWRDKRNDWEYICDDCFDVKYGNEEEK